MCRSTKPTARTFVWFAALVALSSMPLGCSYEMDNLRALPRAHDGGADNSATGSGGSTGKDASKGGTMAAESSVGGSSGTGGTTGVDTPAANGGSPGGGGTLAVDSPTANGGSPGSGGIPSADAPMSSGGTRAIGLDAPMGSGGARGTDDALGLDAPMGNGGATAVGGWTGSGGASMGGQTGTGGTNPTTGGMTGTGGFVIGQSGGTTAATGGVFGTGGIASSGGAIGTGGIVGSGGTGTGGIVGSGGTGSGGIVGSGGTGTGGAVGSGGAGAGGTVGSGGTGAGGALNACISGSTLCPSTETLAQGQGQPNGLAVDADGAFWSNTDDGTIMMLPTGASAPVLVSYGQTTPVAVATDASFVYWWAHMGTGNQGVRKANKAPNQTPADVASAAPPHSTFGNWSGVSLAVGTQYVHWVIDDPYSGASLFMAPLAGGSPPTLIDENGGSSSPGALRTDDTSVYWIAYVLKKAPLGGGAVQTLFDNSNYNAGLDLRAGSVYLLNHGASHWTVKQIPSQGGPPMTTQINEPQLGAHTWLGTDGVSFYWNSYADGASGGATIWRLPTSGGTPVPIANTNDSYPGMFVLYGGYVYWTEPIAGFVRRAPK